MPAALTILRRIFGEAAHLSNTHSFGAQPSRPIRRMLDVGTGPGTAIWSAGQVWPELKYAHGVDKHQSMLDALQFIWKGGPGDKQEQEKAELQYRRGGAREADDRLDEDEEDDDEAVSPRVSPWLHDLDARIGDWAPPPDLMVHTSRDLVKVVEGVERHPDRHRFDLVSAAWVLGEMDAAAASQSLLDGSASPRSSAGGPGSMSLAAVFALWGCVEPGGLLVLVEPGDHQGSKRLMLARQAILDAYGSSGLDPADSAQGGATAHAKPKGLGGDPQAKRAAKRKKEQRRLRTHGGAAVVLGPCTHHHKCPFAASTHAKKKNPETGKQPRHGRGGSDEEGDNGGWCRFVQRVPHPHRNSTGFPVGDEKFSYLILHKTGPAATSTTATSAYSSSPSSSETESSKATRSDVATASPLAVSNIGVRDVNDSGGGRIIRTPLKRRGHVVVDVCRPRADEDYSEEGSLSSLSNESKGGGTNAATIERLVVSKGKYPVLYPAARKATWGGLWPAAEEPFLRVPKGFNQDGSEAGSGNNWVLSEETGGEAGLAKWFQEHGLPREEAVRAAAAAALAQAAEEQEHDDQDDQRGSAGEGAGETHYDDDDEDEWREGGDGVDERKSTRGVYPDKGSGRVGPSGGDDDGWLDADREDDDEDDLDDEVNAFLKRVTGVPASASLSTPGEGGTTFGTVVEEEDGPLADWQHGNADFAPGVTPTLDNDALSENSVKAPPRSGRRRRLSRLLGRQNNKKPEEGGD